MGITKKQEYCGIQSQEMFVPKWVIAMSIILDNIITILEAFIHLISIRSQ